MEEHDGWHCAAGSWSRALVFNTPDDEEWEDTLARLKFTTYNRITLGIESAGFFIMMWRRDDAPRFLAGISFINGLDYVMMDDLPDVLDFLARYAHIITAAEASYASQSLQSPGDQNGIMSDILTSIEMNRDQVAGRVRSIREGMARRAEERRRLRAQQPGQSMQPLASRLPLWYSHFQETRTRNGGIAMDAGTRASILDEALSRLEAGDGTAEGRLRVLSAVFSAGYGYGLSQGHYDRDAEHYGVEGSGVIPEHDAAISPSRHRTGRDETPPIQAARQSLKPVEEPSHRHNRRGIDYTCKDCPDRVAERETDGHFHQNGLHPGWLGHNGLPVHQHDMMTGRTRWEAGSREPAAERYAQQAKARLAARIGEDLAEEFTSVAASTERDIVNTAELMAAAYEMGRQAARQPCEPEDQPLASDEPGQAVPSSEAEPAAQPAAGKTSYHTRSRELGY